MGCGSSIASSNTPQLPAIAEKHLHDSSTQTDQIEVVDAWANTLTSNNSKEERPSSSKHVQSQATPESISSSESDNEYPTVPLNTLEQQLAIVSNPRLSASPTDDEIRWVLFGVDAQRFCTVVQKEICCTGPTVIQDALEAMKKTDDLVDLPKTIWALLETATRKDDATYFIRAYTAESTFYRILNRTLAKCRSEDTSNMDQEQQLMLLMRDAFANVNDLVNRVQAFQAGQPLAIENGESNWAKLYLRPLWKLLVTPNAAIRFQGRTYRGLWLSSDDLMRYAEESICVSNKAITSTSKSRSVAQGFIDRDRQASAGMFSVIFTYVIESDIALYALDVEKFSGLPEEEVLLMPGIPLTVSKTQFIPPCSVEIELSSALQNFIASMMPVLNSSSCPVQ